MSCYIYLSDQHLALLHRAVLLLYHFVSLTVLCLQILNSADAEPEIQSKEFRRAMEGSKRLGVHV